MKKYSIIISSVYILFSSAMSVESETKNVNEKFAFIKEIYSDSWALIIGINDYKHVKSLNYAEDDALAVKEILIERYGFNEGDSNIRFFNKCSSQMNEVNDGESDLIFSDSSCRANKLIK